LLNPFHRVYARLYDHFGPQGWWPTTPPGETRPRYYPGQIRDRLSAAEQWEIIVGAVLTQNTAWRNVEQALGALSARGLLNLQAILTLDLDELACCIRPSGYYHQKARRLQHIARHVAEGYDGRVPALLSGPPASLRQELLDLPGIGPETADSILLYAARYPFFVIDAYTRRICSRLGLVVEKASYAELQTRFTEALPADPDLFGECHALLVKHATTYCRKKPRCDSCFLKGICSYDPPL